MSSKIFTVLFVGALCAGVVASLAVERAATSAGAASGLRAAGDSPSSAAAGTSIMPPASYAPPQPRTAAPPQAGAPAPIAAPPAAEPVAIAEPEPPHVEPDDDELLDVVEFSRTGKGRLVIAIAIVLLVRLLRRHAFRRVAWFGTTIGGYTAAFGTTMLLYASAALGADVVSLDVLADGVATGFAASGQHEAARDAAAAVKRRAAVIGTALLVMLAAACPASGCAPAARVGGAAGPALIDCIGANQEAIQALGDELAELAKRGSWSAVFERAREAGKVIGGCALVETVRGFYAPAFAPMPADAHETLERFRAEVAGGALWRTVRGDV